MCTYWIRKAELLKNFRWAGSQNVSIFFPSLKWSDVTITSIISGRSIILNRCHSSSTLQRKKSVTWSPVYGKHKLQPHHFLWHNISNTERWKLQNPTLKSLGQRLLELYVLIQNYILFYVFTWAIPSYINISPHLPPCQTYS